MPFGLKTSPKILQRLIDKIHRGAHDHEISHLDDIVIFSKTYDLHVAHIRNVLERLFYLFYGEHI